VNGITKGEDGEDLEKHKGGGLKNRIKLHMQATSTGFFSPTKKGAARDLSGNEDDLGEV